MTDATDAGEVEAALERLRRDADAALAPWPDITWQVRKDGSQDGSLTLRNGHFLDLRLEPGRRLDLEAGLQVPAQVQGVRVAGEPLEAMVNTLYPVEVAWNERSAVPEGWERVAPGPALIEAVPALQEGDGGKLRLRVLVPDQQTSPWFRVRLTTPGLRRRHRALDLAWARLALAHEVAASDGERRIVEHAATLVPPTLDGLDGPALEEALAPSAAALAPLADRISGLGVHVIGHCHIDMNWLWTWPDTLEVIERDLQTITGLMEEYPELTFTHSQAATYAAFERERPETFERIRKLVASGRWEVASMQWVESDLNLPSGEALSRQFLEGVRWSRDRLGVSPSTFLAPDTFGHTQNFPQLAVSAGARRYYHMRCNPGHPDPWPVYWWEGADGSRLLVTSTHSYNGEISAGAIAASAIDAHRHGLPAGLLFHGMGDHGGGPTRQGLELLRDLQRQEGIPRVRCSTLAAYTDEVLTAGATLPVHHGELGFIFQGCYTAHSDSKLRNRQGENALTTADTLSALAGLDGGEPMRDAWRLLLFNQFHDILDGSSIHEAYEKNAEDADRTLDAARAATARALDVLQNGVPAGEIAVTNPLGWEREEVVLLPGPAKDGPDWLEADDGTVTPTQRTPGGLLFTVRLRPFATHRLRPHDGAGHEGTEEVDGPRIQEGEQAITVETPFFRARIDRASGVITSLLDRRVGREVVAHPGTRASGVDARPELGLGVFQVLDEDHHPYGAWALERVRAETSLIGGTSAEVVETGPVRVVIAVTHRVRRSSIVQRMAFYRSLPRIDFETTVDWDEPAGPEGFADLKVAFGTRLGEVEAWYETAFGAVRRPADGAEVPALRWADLGNGDYGLALLNDSKHGHDGLGSRLRLTLVHGADYPDPLMDVGRQEIRYSLVPHPGGWREAGIARLGLNFNQPPLVGWGGGGARAPLPAWSAGLEGARSVLLASAKPAAAGGGVVLRLYESAGCAGEVDLPVGAGTRAVAVNLVEDPLAELRPRDGRVHLAFRPFEVRSVLLTPASRGEG